MKKRALQIWLFFIGTGFFIQNAYLFATEPKPVKPLLIEGSIDRFHFKLNNDKQYCQLAIDYTDGAIPWFPLASQSPCYFFADNKQEKIQSYSYPDENIDYILLIGGTETELSAEKRKNKKMPVASYCTEEIQAIIIEKGEIKLGTTQTNAFACAEDRLDEKVYQQNTKQPRKEVEKVVQEQLKKQTALETSFFESLQQKIEAIFK